ncbi:2OG-Fe(II) oxygenase [Myxococcota bacterium]|nr:2OG-Fe(II) oxygenase [Myxococcota bacterium]
MATLAAPPPALLARLQGDLLVEGPAVQAVRARLRDARLASAPRPPVLPGVPAVDWALAEDLPDGVSPRWRDGEGLRRAAEERAAGRRLTILRGFLAPAFCEVLLREVQALPMQRLETDVVRAWRHPVEHGLRALRELLEDPGTRRLLGAVLGLELPGPMRLNAWRHDPGDHLAAHPDGGGYVATAALGLNPGWTAADGGAIAFGQPQGDGILAVTERWLPHSGDLALFVPGPETWHVVEPSRRARWTVSGWWVGPAAAETT